MKISSILLPTKPFSGTSPWIASDASIEVPRRSSRAYTNTRLGTDRKRFVPDKREYFWKSCSKTLRNSFIIYAIPEERNSYRAFQTDTRGTYMVQTPYRCPYISSPEGYRTSAEGESDFNCWKGALTTLECVVIFRIIRSWVHTSSYFRGNLLFEFSEIIFLWEIG